MPRIPIITDEYYHIFGHAIESRDLTCDKYDSSRFLESLQEFNSVKPIGSIFEHRYHKEHKQTGRLVEVVCYCLNPNHFHLILRQSVDMGIGQFMHKMGTGLTNYYNEKYKRKGSIFRGRYKVVPITSNEQLLYASVYASRNNEVHQLGGSASKLVRSSWPFYATGAPDPILSGTDIICGQFNSRQAYVRYADDALSLMLEHKREQAESSMFDLIDLQ